MAYFWTMKRQTIHVAAGYFFIAPAINGRMFHWLEVLPKNVTLGLLSYSVREYVPKPLRC